MVDALKKMDKKFLIFIGCIILFPVVLIIILVILRGCTNAKLTPKAYEEKMITAAETYFKDKKLIPKTDGVKNSVKLSELVKGEYINSPEDTLGDDSCEGEVSVIRTGSNIESTNGGFINYVVNLECKKYKTKTLIDSLMNNVVTSGSGLYKDGNSYIFKGDETKNYINFFGVNYRIVSIDSNGIVKLVKETYESIERYWDIKYNTEVNDASGKNIYADSSILKQLITDYENPKIFSEDAKKHIVPYDVCIGKRDINDNSISSSVDCSAVLNNQVISLLNVSDFAKASLDSECNSIISKSCRNYNYMKNLHLKTWTPNAVSNNSYEVYYLMNGLIDFAKASEYKRYNLVIYIDGNEVITSGVGSEISPYVIK